MKLSLKQQLMIIISLFVFVAVLLVCLYLYYLFNGEMTERTLAEFNGTLNNYSENIENALNSIQRLNDNLSVNEVFVNSASGAEDDIISRLSAVSRFKQEYSKMERLILGDLSEVSAARFLINDEMTVAADIPGADNVRLFELNGENVYRAKRLQLENVLNVSEDMQLVKSEEGDGYLIFGQFIYDNVTFSKKMIGLNLVQINARLLFERYNNNSGRIKVQTAIVSGDNYLVYSNSDLPKEKIFSCIEQYGKNYSKDKLISVKGEQTDYVARIYPISFDLKLFVLIDESDMRFEAKEFTLKIFLVAGIVLTIMLITVGILLDKLTKPVRQLSTVMVNFRESSNLQIKNHNSNIVEVQQLYDCFNSMAERIKQLLCEAHNSGKREMELEMRLLESQINPHFLYNALDSMAWIALMHGEDEIADMASDLSDGLRYSVKETEKPIKLRDEINFIIGYLHLQEIRYQGKFIFQMNVNEDTFDLLVPKFVLQPLVENSVIHGLNSRNKTITIKLTSVISGEELVISICDDGPGFEPDKLNRYLDGDSEVFAEEKIGIKNVHRRIKMKFGDEYGLRYYKTDGEFIAQTRMPVKREA